MLGPVEINTQGMASAVKIVCNLTVEKRQTRDNENGEKNTGGELASSIPNKISLLIS